MYSGWGDGRRGSRHSAFAFCPGRLSLVFPKLQTTALATAAPSQQGSSSFCTRGVEGHHLEEAEGHQERFFWDCSALRSSLGQTQCCPKSASCCGVSLLWTEYMICVHLPRGPGAVRRSRSPVGSCDWWDVSRVWQALLDNRPDHVSGGISANPWVYRCCGFQTLHRGAHVLWDVVARCLVLTLNYNGPKVGVYSKASVGWTKGRGCVAWVLPFKVDLRLRSLWAPWLPTVTFLGTRATASLLFRLVQTLRGYSLQKALRLPAWEISPEGRVNLHAREFVWMTGRTTGQETCEWGMLCAMRDDCLSWWP